LLLRAGAVYRSGMASRKPRRGQGRTGSGREPGHGPAKRQRNGPVLRALGNDPFQRGAAVRPPALPRELPAVAEPQPPRQVEAAVIPAPPEAGPGPGAPPPARPHLPGNLAALEGLIDAAIHEAEARLGAAARSGGAGLARARDDVSAILRPLWPVLRDKLASAGDLARLLEPPMRLERFGMDARLVGRTEPLMELLYSRWWRVAVAGLEHLPLDGPAVLACNHAGSLPWDALVVRHAVRRERPGRELRPLLDDAACDRPVVGQALLRLGAVRASPEAAQALLSAGTAVAVFPEGSAVEGRPWHDRYRLGRFGRGFVRVALRAGAPIVPCAIVGSEETAPPIARTGWLAELLRLPFLATEPALRLPAAGMLPLPARWSLTFGAPIDLGGAGPERADDPVLASQVADRTRQALQGMLDEAVAARRSVFL